MDPSSPKVIEAILDLPEACLIRLAGIPFSRHAGAGLP